MEYIKAFLTNNIVIAWIAPIVTAVIATVIIKAFSVRKKNKEIKEANQRYADLIRPYVIQKIKIDEVIIHGIRNAISVEMSVPEKYMYSDSLLMNMLIYDITTTRFLTEQGKNELIQNIVTMFMFKENATLSYGGTERKNINKKGIILAVLIGIFGLAITIMLYYLEPEEAKNPNSIIQFIMLISMLISLFSLVGATWSVLDIKIERDLYSDKGIIGNLIQAELQLAENITSLLFGRTSKRKNKQEAEKEDEK